jgi:Domain of unknown function (DUF4383)
MTTTAVSTTAKRAPVQTIVLVLSAVLFVWSVIALIAYPDFSTGADASSEKILGADMNGWHSLSGILLFGPGIIAAMRRDWAVLFGFAAAVSLIASGVWILLDASPAGLVALPDNEVDAVLFHIVPGVIYGAAAAAAVR